MCYGKAICDTWKIFDLFIVIIFRKSNKNKSVKVYNQIDKKKNEIRAINIGTVLPQKIGEPQNSGSDKIINTFPTIHELNINFQFLFELFIIWSGYHLQGLSHHQTLKYENTKYLL